jgi:hypothetical protein
MGGPSALAADLFTWNDPGASGTTWPGWTWYSDASGFGDPGWRRNDYDQANYLPRSHQKGDYGNRVLAAIDAVSRAPSTASGGSLKVYNVGGTDSTAAWWFLPKTNYGDQGLTNSSTDRFDFYFKATGFSLATWNTDIENYNVHFGTYLCWPGGSISGEGCPKEASGQHYYHWLTVNPDAWLHVQFDRHPQHIRGGSVPPPSNPAPGGRNYYQYFAASYLEIFAGQQPKTYWVDEMRFSQTSQPENEISISSVWVGYWPSTGKWEMGWCDGSFSQYGNASNSTFEIRWSTSPITGSNYSQATAVIPEYNKLGSTNSVRRPNPWKIPAWTRFTLPSTVVQNNDKIYFAIKDVSSTANGDGHNAPSTLIRTIDYDLRPAGTSLPAPSNLRVVQ